MKRKTYKKKFSIKKRTKAGTKALNQNTVYQFKRVCQLADVYSNNTAIPYSTGNYTFQLDQLPEYTDFTALYDQYMITGIKLTFFPYTSEQILSQGTKTSAGQLMYLIDDSNPTAGFTSTLDAYSHQGIKVRSGQGNHWSVYFKVKPEYLKPDDAAYAISGITTAKNNQWLSLTSPAVPHLGFRWLWDFAEPPRATSQFFQHVMATYYVKFRKVN